MQRDQDCSKSVVTVLSSAEILSGILEFLPIFSWGTVVQVAKYLLEIVLGSDSRCASSGGRATAYVKHGCVFGAQSHLKSPLSAFGGPLAKRLVSQLHLDPERTYALTARLFLANTSVFYEEFGAGGTWAERWKFDSGTTGLSRPLVSATGDREATAFSLEGRLRLQGCSDDLVCDLGANHQICEVRVRIAVGIPAEEECSAGHLSLEDAIGRVCLYVKLLNEHDHAGMPVCTLQVNMLQHRLEHLPQGPDAFLSLSLQLDWAERIVRRISVNGFVLDDEADFKRPACEGVRHLLLCNVFGKRVASYWRDLTLTLGNDNQQGRREKAWLAVCRFANWG